MDGQTVELDTKYEMIKEALTLVSVVMPCGDGPMREGI
jgi:hypothetical protein